MQQPTHQGGKVSAARTPKKPQKFEQEFFAPTKEEARAKANAWLERVLGSPKAEHNEITDVRPDPERPGEFLEYIRVYGDLPEGI